MTLAHGTDRLESDCLVLRRVTSDDLPFFTRLHALPNLAQFLYPGGRPSILLPQSFLFAPLVPAEVIRRMGRA